MGWFLVFLVFFLYMSPIIVLIFPSFDTSKKLIFHQKSFWAAQQRALILLLVSAVSFSIFTTQRLSLSHNKYWPMKGSCKTCMITPILGTQHFHSFLSSGGAASYLRNMHADAPCDHNELLKHFSANQTSHARISKLSANSR